MNMGCVERRKAKWYRSSSEIGRDFTLISVIKNLPLASVAVIFNATQYTLRRTMMCPYLVRSLVQLCFNTQVLSLFKMHGAVTACCSPAV